MNESSVEIFCIFTVFSKIHFITSGAKVLNERGLESQTHLKNTWILCLFKSRELFLACSQKTWRDGEWAKNKVQLKTSYWTNWTFLSWSLKKIMPNPDFRTLFLRDTSKVDAIDMFKQSLFTRPLIPTVILSVGAKWCYYRSMVKIVYV